jgi:hypothetical protein
MKTLIYAAAFMLAITPSVPAALAGGALRDAKAPHLVHSGAHPNNARLPSATHHFEVHLQGKDLSQLSVDLPEGIKVKRGIEVTDQSGKKLDATVSAHDRRVTIAFFQPVTSGTRLSVSLKGVETLYLQRRIWLYPVYGRSVDMNADMRLGIARIQTYR